MEERKLIKEDGRPNFGIFSKPLNVINIEDLRPYGEEKSSYFSKNIMRLFNLKRWQYMGITNSEIVFGSAIVSTGYLGNVFLYLFNRKKKELFEVSFIKPFAGGITFTGSAEEGEISFKSGKNLLKYELSKDFIILTLQHKDILTANIKYHRIKEPLSVVVRESLTGFNYTNKEAGMVVEGEIILNNDKFTLKKEDSFGVLDYTIGHLSRETFWNWASGGGLLENGERIGFNLSAGVNETGITENVFWINDRLYKLETVKFEYSDLDIMKEWRIHSNDENLAIIFTPEGLRKADINAVFIKSKFFQPFGRFGGYIKVERNRLALKEVYGFAEEHFAKW